MPSFNSKDHIFKAINSVLMQTYSNWELLITDDCSNDGTFEEISKYVQDESRIKICRLDENSGPAAARNSSITLAKGRYIAFLDSDDVWLEDKLFIQINNMLANDICFSYTAYQTVNESGLIVREKINVPLKLTYKDLLKTCDIYCSTVVYDVAFFGKTLMPDIRKRQDFALWLKLLKIAKHAYGINDVLMKYQLTDNSVSSNKFKAAKFQFNVYYKIEKLGFLSSVYYTCLYAVYGMLKTYFGKTRKL